MGRFLNGSGIIISQFRHFKVYIRIGWRLRQIITKIPIQLITLTRTHCKCIFFLPSICIMTSFKGTISICKKSLANKIFSICQWSSAFSCWSFLASLYRLILIVYKVTGIIPTLMNNSAHLGVIHGTRCDVVRLKCFRFERKGVQSFCTTSRPAPGTHIRQAIVL